MSPRRQGSTTPARSSPSNPASRRAGRTRLLFLFLLSALALLAPAGCGSGEETGTTGATTPAATGKRAPGDGRGGVELTGIGRFEAPLYVDQPPGVKSIYVVEQGGRIVRVAPDGEQSTFLDIADEIVAEGEQGLLSVAFDPGFEESGLLYVDFTDANGDTRVVEYRSEDGGATADPGSARELLEVRQPYPNHNGGLVEFGPDGRLYVGLGDGGGGGDPDRTAQDPDTPLGKILALDPASPKNPETFALGLRNPWRFSFDRQTGALSIGDVGQDSLEEVNLTAATEAEGANYGWSAFEGTERFNADQEAPGAIEPVLTYPQDDEHCSVTGGYVVRDRRLESLWGRYVYGDLCAGEIRSFTARPGDPATDDRPVGREVRVPRLSSFGEDESGLIYATSLEGPVYRLDPAGP